MKAEENFEENYCLQKTNKLHDTNGVVNICTLNNHNKSARLCNNIYLNPNAQICALGDTSAWHN